jgi:asparagine synthase (glutamine-hydrolysing)
MCGIAGFVHIGRYDREQVAREMCARLSHRGPDDSGIWSDESAGITLGHRRLSIIDLSPLGHQPMDSPGGQFVTVYNGEIYNFGELARELSTSVRFKGSSDTEVMLAAFEAWGIEGALSRFNGMFSIALWDRANRVLTLARDRIGEKPLYYGWIRGGFVFASEVGALKAHPDFGAEIDRDAVALFMQHSHVPEPYSIYREIFKLMPGSHLQITLPMAAARPAGFSPFADSGVSAPKSFWSARNAVEAGQVNPLRLSDAEALAELEKLLIDSVKMRMISDVPLGAFLSGGIDSSTVVALMQQCASQPVKTFSIGFIDREFDEAGYARDVAARLGTEHHELYVTPEEAMGVVQKLPALYSEPFADSSQIPTYLVAEMARRSVTVALSGDGGDELFGGYNRYIWADRFWRKLGPLPGGLRGAIGALLRTLKPATWDGVMKSMKSLLPSSLGFKYPGEKIHRFASLISRRERLEFYGELVSLWTDPLALVRGSSRLELLVERPEGRLDRHSFLEQMMFFDLIFYLPGDILAKVDRASMAHSLEGRMPLLDHRLVEFAWRLPLNQRIRAGSGKWLLRKLLEKRLPVNLIDRPKMGFSVPAHDWIRGPLKAWAEALLEPGRIRREGFLDEEMVTEKWRQHRSGERNWLACLWNVLMFQAWLENERCLQIH